MSQEDLEDRIAKLRVESGPHGAAKADHETDPGIGRAMMFGLSAGAQFVGSVIFGGGLGWLIDRWLGTSPFGMVLLMVAFFGAALVNVWFMMSRAVATATESSSADEIPPAGADKVTDSFDGKSS